MKPEPVKKQEPTVAAKDIPVIEKKPKQKKKEKETHVAAMEEFMSKMLKTNKET